MTTSVLGVVRHNECAPAGWSRAELIRLRDAAFELADSAVRQQLALGLASCLGDPDPVLRDEVAFSAQSRWLRGRMLDAATIVTLAERLERVLRTGPDPQGFGQPFAALVLSEIVRADRIEAVLTPALRDSIIGAAIVYLGELRDYRGFDTAEGWRHGVAHGADLVLQIGVHPKVTVEQLQALLRTLKNQVAPAAGVSYVFGEGERLARAVFFIHRSGRLDASYWDAWLAGVGDPGASGTWAATFASAQGLARRHNTLAFLHALSFMARDNPGEASASLAALADRELTRIHGG